MSLRQAGNSMASLRQSHENRTSRINRKLQVKLVVHEQIETVACDSKLGVSGQVPQ
jgi:hypothetical protein